MKPARDPKYLAFIRCLPCSVPGCAHTRIEAAHTTAKGLRGMSQKADDRSAIPLCNAHHREIHQIGEFTFQARYRLDIKQIVDTLNLKPIIRVRDGRFVGQIEGREYQLGLVGIGHKQAMKHMIQFRREELRCA